jgi:hypothetical protein
MSGNPCELRLSAALNSLATRVSGAHARLTAYSASYPEACVYRTHYQHWILAAVGEGGRRMGGVGSFNVAALNERSAASLVVSGGWGREPRGSSSRRTKSFYLRKHLQDAERMQTLTYINLQLLTTRRAQSARYPTALSATDMSIEFCSRTSANVTCLQLCNPKRLL